jgi:ATP-dependent Clp protease ATP-binding subunit ClpX
VKQYTKLFEIEGIALTMDEEVYDFMVEKAMEYKLGARGLRSICENILTDAMFELPSGKEKVFHVNAEYAKKKFDKSKMSLLKVA